MAERTLDELFVQHRPKLLWTVYRIVRCSETAEDVVQETYLRVAAALQDHPVLTLQPFLYRTARNLAIDYVRGKRIRGRIVAPAGDGVDEVPSTEPSPERQTLDRQRVGRLEAALAELPPRRRQILILARLHGWTYSRIAAHLGLSESAVQKNVRVALAHCLEALGENDESQV